MPEDGVTATETQSEYRVEAAAGQGQVPVGGGRVGRFVPFDTLGVGSMGVVLAAYDPELDRRVALKLLRHGWVDGGTAGEQRRDRLLREAQAMARLAHPNVVTVFEVGTLGDQVYLAMEFVNGQTLRAWVGREPRTWRQIVEVFLAAGRGLAAAHAAGLVHRDFKPDNVLVGNDGRVRVSDFGLASTSSDPLEDTGPGRREPIRAGALLRGLTVEGAVLGTPAYMALEQHEGGAVGPKADQFAFCASLYEALHGERPFRADSYPGLVEEVKLGRVREPPRGAKVPAWLRAVVVRGLSPDPAQRHPDMEALLKVLGHDPRAGRRRAAAATATVAVAALAGWGLLARPTDPMCTGARERLAGVWDPGVRDRLEKAFLGTQLTAARDSFDRVAAHLSRYADAWVAMHTDSCRATRVRGEQSPQLLDLRTACLERRRSELSALTSALQGVDRRMLPRAVEAAADLPPIDPCADVEALRALVPPPGDPEAARKVKDLEERMTRLATLTRLGQEKELFDEGMRLAAEANAIGYAPLRARTQLLLSKHFAMQGDLASSEKSLLEMSRAAAEGRDDRQLVTALGRLALNHEMREANAQSLATGQAAEMVARRIGDDQALSIALIGITMSLQALGRLDQARTTWEEANATVEKLAKKEDQAALISPLMHLGTAAALHGNYAMARDNLERALAIASAALGPGHARTLQLQQSASVVATDQGRLDEALALASAALEERRRQEPTRRLAAENLIDLARPARLLGDLPRAERLLLDAREIESRVGRRGAGMHHARGLAELRIDQGRYQEAQELLQPLVEAHDTGDSPRRKSVFHMLLGTVAQKLGQPARALEHFEQSLALRKKVSGTEHPGYGESLAALAGLYVAQGRCRQALPMLDEAQTTLEKALDKDHYLIAQPLILRARCHLEQGKPVDALPALARSVELRERAKLALPERGRARALLARALWEAPGGDRARASAEAATAEQELLAGGAATATELAELRVFLRRRTLSPRGGA
jgi:eukaryotic-like serine/threonine-protein kinase